MQLSQPEASAALQLGSPLPELRAVEPTPAGAPARCSRCRVRNLCLPGAVDDDDHMSIDELVVTRKRVHSGDHLVRAGDPFDSLYAFHSGLYKSYLVTVDGHAQVTGFPMAGDCAGMDAVGSATHTQNVVALETGEVCVVPYVHLQRLSSGSAALRQQVNRVMSREIVREQHVMMLLGSMQAEAKVAEFLLSLSSRFAQRGYSPTEFNLWMTRAEIGSYLGLQLETISRALSKLHRLGAIRMKVRHVRIVDCEALRSMTRESGKQRLADPGQMRPSQPSPRIGLPLLQQRPLAVRWAAGVVPQRAGRGLHVDPTATIA